MAPDAPFYVAPSEPPYSVLDRKKGRDLPALRPHGVGEPRQGQEQKVELSLLVHPQWLAGEAKQDANGQPLRRLSAGRRGGNHSMGCGTRREYSPAGSAWRTAG